MKSLLTKASGLNQNNYSIIGNLDSRDVIMTLLKLPTILTKSFDLKSLNDIADYVYTLTSKYNKFYASNKILIEKNQQLQESWLVLTNIVYKTNLLLLDILGLKVPEKM